jgi:hypothetical protein
MFKSMRKCKRFGAYDAYQRDGHVKTMRRPGGAHRVLLWFERCVLLSGRLGFEWQEHSVI